jgi:hypothetical protein
MRYIVTFICTFLAVLALSAFVLSLFSVAVLFGVVWTGSIPNFMIEVFKSAILFGFTAVVIHLLGETCCCRSTSFKTTVTYVGAVTAGTMVIAGIWFGLLSRPY